MEWCYNINWLWSCCTSYESKLGCNEKFISGSVSQSLSFMSFYLPSFRFPLSFPALNLKWPSKPAKSFGSTVSCSLAWENDIWNFWGPKARFCCILATLITGWWCWWWLWWWRWHRCWHWCIVVDLTHMRVVKSDRHDRYARDNGMSSFFVSAKTGESVGSTWDCCCCMIYAWASAKYVIYRF